jgi:hypothetical protein
MQHLKETTPGQYKLGQVYNMPLQSVIATGTFFEIESDGTSVWYVLPSEADVAFTVLSKQAADRALEAELATNTALLNDISVSLTVQSMYSASIDF